MPIGKEEQQMIKKYDHCESKEGVNLSVHPSFPSDIVQRNEFVEESRRRWPRYSFYELRNREIH